MMDPKQEFESNTVLVLRQQLSDLFFVVFKILVTTECYHFGPVIVIRQYRIQYDVFIDPYATHRLDGQSQEHSIHHH